jgi:lipoprotein-anchoring transpeptidase ErfK/SrfK
VTVNGKPIQGGWYFEYSSRDKHYPIEGHWRPQNFWQPHSKVHVDIPAKGLSAGGNMAYNDSLTLDFYIGAKHIGVVNDATHELTITNDGRQWGTFPVSLGATSTPTRHGFKVIMEKRPTVCMHDIAGTYFECGIKLDQRLTYDGEYLHSAPWNVRNIGHTDTSNGCTNLLPSDAQKLYHFLEIGDVINYPNADGKAMQMGDGYGDWNVNWGTWLTGGLVSTTT